MPFQRGVKLNCFHETACDPASFYRFNCCARRCGPPRCDADSRAWRRCPRWLGPARNPLCFFASVAIVRFGLVFARCFWQTNMEACPLNSTFPVSALSLTTPTVSRDFIFSVHEHTFPIARASRLCGCLVHLCHPNRLGPFPLHRSGVAHQTSLRSRSTMMS